MKHKIGTLRCRLFGHNFSGKFHEKHHGEWFVITCPSDYCIRCGITREEIKYLSEAKQQTKDLINQSKSLSHYEEPRQD